MQVISIDQLLSVCGGTSGNGLPRFGWGGGQPEKHPDEKYRSPVFDGDQHVGWQECEWKNNILSCNNFVATKQTKGQ